MEEPSRSAEPATNRDDERQDASHEKSESACSPGPPKPEDHDKGSRKNGEDEFQKWRMSWRTGEFTANDNGQSINR